MHPYQEIADDYKELKVFPEPLTETGHYGDLFSTKEAAELFAVNIGSDSYTVTPKIINGVMQWHLSAYKYPEGSQLKNAVEVMKQAEKDKEEQIQKQLAEAKAKWAKSLQVTPGNAKKQLTPQEVADAELQLQAKTITPANNTIVPVNGIKKKATHIKYSPDGKILDIDYEIAFTCDKYDLIKDEDMYRLRAKRNIPTIGVLNGDFGGRVDAMGVLSEHGDCWIDFDAKVFDGAGVTENAFVTGNACVCGKGTRISGDALVHDEANIDEYCLVADESQVLGNTTLSGGVELRGATYIDGGKDGVSLSCSTVLNDCCIQSQPDHKIFEDNYVEGFCIGEDGVVLDIGVLHSLPYLTKQKPQKHKSSSASILKEFTFMTTKSLAFDGGFMNVLAGYLAAFTPQELYQKVTGLNATLSKWDVVGELKPYLDKGGAGWIELGGHASIEDGRITWVYRHLLLMVADKTKTCLEADHVLYKLLDLITSFYESLVVSINQKSIISMEPVVKTAQKQEQAAVVEPEITGLEGLD